MLDSVFCFYCQTTDRFDAWKYQSSEFCMFSKIESVLFYFRISTSQPMWCSRPTMSAAAREGRWWALGAASEAAPSGSRVTFQWRVGNAQPVLYDALLWISKHAGFHLSSRPVWRREDHHQLRLGRVPGVPRHPLLLPGRRQRSPRTEQEPGLLRRRSGRKHPAYCWGGQAVRRRRPGVYHQLHLSVQQGQQTAGFTPCVCGTEKP